VVSPPPPTSCTTKRQITSHVPPVSDCWLPYTHRDCTHNEYAAIRNRVVGSVPQPTETGLQLLYAEARILCRQLPLTAPMSTEAFVDHYSGRRRERYQQAVDSLSVKPLDPVRESYINAFVKAEKFNPAAKRNPDPRMIQARNARFNTSIGVYLKPIEHHLYRLKSASGLPLIGKGLNHQERGEVLWEKWNRFSKPVCVSIDAKRFDQHVAAKVLEVEHWVYLRCCGDHEFAWMLKQQLKNRCFTRNGWRYKVDGSRMSGDMNTALGNCVLMILMVHAALRALGVSKFELFDDGDDCLIILEESQLLTFLDGVDSQFLAFGQEIKIENIAKEFEDIEWCQTRPVRGLNGRYQMCASWRKTLSQGCAGTHYWDNHRAPDMSFSVGQCIAAVYPAMPIIWKYAQRLCTRGQMHKDLINTEWLFKLSRTNLQGALGKLEANPPDMDTRSSFARAWGVDEIEQLRIEKTLDDWTPCMGTPTIAGNPVSGDWVWEYPPGCCPTDRDVIPSTK
jgi:hypothetical protein